MVQEHRGEYPSLWAAVESIATKIGCVPQTLLEWVKRQEVDTGVRDGVPTADAQRMKELEREVKECRALGFVIDWVCYLPFLLLAALVFPESQTVTAVDLLVWLTMAWLYQTLQLTSKKQATWGMRAVGIFRTDLHGRRLSFARASAWHGLRLVSYAIYGLGFVCQPFTAKKQTLHDLLSKSVVLRRPSAAPAAAPLVPARPASRHAEGRRARLSAVTYLNLS